MILNISNLSKSYVGQSVLKEVSFHLEEKEKAAIVGINGSGKTTLLRCILGIEEADEGGIAFSKDKKMAYLAQQHADMEQEDEEYESLSGGQKTKKRLEEILMEKPDLLILDEPTNHLDIGSIQWLEKVLKRYDGAVLLVSHDRYFLDKIVTKVIDLERGKARMYLGNYTAYAEKKKMIREAERKAYENQQAEIKHQEAVIEKLKQFNREKSIKRAESREKLLSKVERLEQPEDLQNEMRLLFMPREASGNDVLIAKDLGKSFDGKRLFSHGTFSIQRGEHVAVIGDNGTGKTTLLKILNGLIQADEGEFRLGSKVKIAYYDQEHAVLHMEKTLFNEIQDTYPDMNNTRVRNVLAAFLFTGDDVYKKVGDLSGGERGRVSLAKLMLSDANFLILDEPTNHLDIQGKEVLEEAIRNYEGTVLYVSHDRYFINQTATRIMELFSNRFDNYIGNYDYYLEKKEDVRSYGDSLQKDTVQNTWVDPEELKKAQEKEAAKQDWASQKEFAAKKRKWETSLKKAEEEIARLEEKITELSTAMEEVGSDAGRLMELHKEQEAAEASLQEQYAIWEESSLALEELEEG
ncbi:ABC-F family ATP-binding cassette domain-containing protein [Oribacterium sinus]|uniref:ABC transporter, ATP-binding protein n=1 Tax=Oribacterium sinus F0268 TaxID=585501 RepID=C2KZ96_9FIRM|nr:ABC-F family ATP-binding cassette domain-containing protein [Oribacterium sinus]EEJ50903.1 ABC transporter, ATP-binding protein [Oribacterium sinus F0268]